MFKVGEKIILSDGSEALVVVSDKKKYQNIIIVEFEKKLRVIDRATKSMAYTNQIK
ncbi:MULTISPECIES: hypothetical protein [unclassified Lactococcus]|uniref:hypothetical protein n=1 Tax=unclassified Lactococcus TaxID=2643510 RepID=UPI001296112F|nr:MULTISPECIES: hypothetical protein [unclassified Lactococcus]MQW23451.1 hypothetical protein [Lactococcus sp. dk101]